MEPKHSLEHISPFKTGLFMLAWKTSSPHPTCLEAQKMTGLCSQIALIYSAKSLSALAAVAFKNMSLITLCLLGLKRIYLPFLFSSWIRSNCVLFCFFSVQMREFGPAKVAFAQVETWRILCACATTSPTSPYLCKWFPWRYENLAFLSISPY